MKKWCGVMVLTAGIVMLVSFIYPSFKNYREEEIFRADVNPSDIILLKDQTAEQQFGLPKGKIAGIVLITKAEENHRRKIHVEINDDQNKIVFKGDKYDVSYLEGKNLLRFTNYSFNADKNRHYFLRVTLKEGSSLVMKVREKGQNNVPLKIDGTDSKYNLAFSVLFDDGIKKDSIIGVIIGLGVMFLSLFVGRVKSEKKRYFIAGAVVSLFIPMAVFGFWLSNGNYGVADWDLNAPIQQGYQDAILKYGQFPFWNAIPCGGSVALADPEFSVFSVPFLMVLFFGVQTGFKFGILFSLIVLALGSFVLAKYFKFSPFGCMIVALVISTGGAFVLHLVEGHIYICFAYAWLPWLIWSWLNAYQGKIRYFWPGLILVLIFMQGGVYIITYSLVIYIALVIVSNNKTRALKTSLVSGIWFCGLSAIKMFPALFWLSHYQDKEYTQSGNTFAHLVDIFLGRYPHGASVFFNQGVGWHELGAYIGPVVIFLVVTGCILGRKERLIKICSVTALASILLSASGDNIKFITDSINFIPRSDFSRFAMLAIIPLALLAGRGLDLLYQKTGSKSLQIVVVGLVAIDLFSLAFPLSRQAFVMPNVPLGAVQAPFPIAYNGERLPKTINNREYTRRYLYTLKGFGFIDYCPSLAPVVGVVSYNGDTNNYFPFVWGKAGGRVQLLNWSHNSFTVEYFVDKQTMIIANQNYAPGWRVNQKPALNFENRVATEVSAGSGRLVFSFVPEGLKIGAIISLLTVVVLVVTNGGFFAKPRQDARKKSRDEN